MKFSAVLTLLFLPQQALGQSFSFARGAPPVTTFNSAGGTGTIVSNYMEAGGTSFVQELGTFSNDVCDYTAATPGLTTGGEPNVTESNPPGENTFTTVIDIVLNDLGAATYTGGTEGTLEVCERVFAASADGTRFFRLDSVITVTVDLTNTFNTTTFQTESVNFDPEAVAGTANLGDIDLVAQRVLASGDTTTRTAIALNELLRIEVSAPDGSSVELDDFISADLTRTDDDGSVTTFPIITAGTVTDNSPLGDVLSGDCGSSGTCEISIGALPLSFFTEGASNSIVITGTVTTVVVTGAGRALQESSTGSFKFEVETEPMDTSAVDSNFGLTVVAGALMGAAAMLV